MLTERDLIEATVSPRTGPSEIALGRGPSSEGAGGEDGKGNDGRQPGEKSSQNAKVPGTDEQDQDVKDTIAALAKRDFKNRDDWFKLAQILKWVAGISDKEADAREFLTKVSDSVREIANGGGGAGKNEPDAGEPLKNKMKADNAKPLKGGDSKAKPKEGDKEAGLPVKKEDLDEADAPSWEYDNKFWDNMAKQMKKAVKTPKVEVKLWVKRKGWGVNFLLMLSGGMPLGGKVISERYLTWHDNNWFLGRSTAPYGETKLSDKQNESPAYLAKHIAKAISMDLVNLRIAEDVGEDLDEDLDPENAIKCISDSIEGIEEILNLLDEARKKRPKPPITGEDWRRIKEFADDITRNADRIVKAIKGKDASNVMETAKKLVTDLEILVQRLVAQYPEADNVAKHLEAAGRILLKLSMEDSDDIDLDSLSEALKMTEGADAKRMRKNRNKVINDFNRAGLDGNGRFRKPQEGYSKAIDILSKYGVELADIPNSHSFNSPSASIDVNLAWSNKEDPFSPQDIQDFMLHLSWHELRKNWFEVIAYLTL